MNNRIVAVNASALLAGLLMSGVSVADASSSAPAFRVGGGMLYPGAGLTVKRDSNILRLSDADPLKKSTTVTVLSPSLVYQVQQNANDFVLAYNADVAKYSGSAADDYVDQNLLGQARMELSMRSTLSLMPAYRLGHDDRGATFGGATTEPNVWQSSGIAGSFTYGAEEARGRLVADFNYDDRKYQNNRSLTAAYDKTLTTVGATAFLRVQPRTSLLLQLKNTGIAYQQAGSNLNGSEQAYMVGVKWDASAQTTGEVRVGSLTKKFDSGLTSYTGGSWEGAVRWSPVSYVNLDLITSRKPNETTLAGSRAILVSNTGANFAYDLNDRVTLQANAYQMKEAFVGATRSDTTDTYGLKADYKFRKWLVGGVEYSNNSKTSNIAGADYKRNVFMLSLRSVL